LLSIGPQYRIYDPATRVRLANGRYQVQPFVNNVIPQRINPVARNILNYWGLPNTTGTRDGVNNLNRTNEPESLEYYNHIARIDHNFSPRNRLFGRFNTYNRYSTHDDWFHSLATGLTEDWLHHSAMLDHVYVLNAATTLNLRYSFYRLLIDYSP
jgi:hypothetical protein